jgi:hypothetical protein
LKKQKELLELEEIILKRKTVIQKIEDNLLKEESNKSEEDLEQFDADFPTKEKVQDWTKKNKNFNDVCRYPSPESYKPGKLKIVFDAASNIIGFR